MKRVEQPEFSKEEGRGGAPTSRDPGDDQLSEYDDERKMVPNTELGFLFCIGQNAKWTDSENNKQGFALDVIFQNKAICNFCLEKNVLLFFREARNAYFIFREL